MRVGIRNFCVISVLSLVCLFLLTRHTFNEVKNSAKTIENMTKENTSSKSRARTFKKMSQRIKNPQEPSPSRNSEQSLRETDEHSNVSSNVVISTKDQKFYDTSRNKKSHDPSLEIPKLDSQTLATTRVNLRNLLKVTSFSLDSDYPLNSLQTGLEEISLTPITHARNSVHTGLKRTIQTDEKKPVAGISDFYARITGDNVDNLSVHHVSFELASFEGNFQIAKDMINQLYGEKIAYISTNTDSYSRWQLENGYIVWAKRMSASDLKNKLPTYTTSQKDIDKIRIAVEWPPHEH